MARYLVIEFEDDAQAEELRRRIDEQTRAGKRFRVAGMFARPRSWCKCPRPTGYHKDEVVMGRRFGWWVHAQCKKPRMGSHQPNNLLTAKEVLAMPGQTTHLEERLGSISIWEVPTENIDRTEQVA